YLPCWLGWGQAFRRAGPYGGFLGQRFDPLITECQPYHDKDGPPPRAGYPRIVRGEPYLPHSSLGTEMTIDPLQMRRGLLRQIDDEVRRLEAQPSLDHFDRTQRRAFDVLTSPKVRGAFDLTKEHPRLVERYGRTLFGHSALIGRRLV